MEVRKISFEAITSLEELRGIIEEPHELVIKKSISFMDDHCKEFISMSPLLFLSTSDGQGKCTASLRGDAPGFVKILNAHQLVIPDRLGNRRLDSIVNILSNPHIGLLFLIPGLEGVLRVNGRGTIIKNKEVLNQMSVKGIAPLLGIGVDVEECFVHCPRALKESKIWVPETWHNKEDLPSIEEMFHSHIKINGVE